MIRAIEHKDLDFLVSIEIEDEGITNSPDKDLSEHQERILTYIESSDFGGFVYENKSQSIACILFSVENRSNTYSWPTVYHEINESYFDLTGNMLAVYQLWVHPDFRCKGIATKLKLALEQEAHSRNIHIIYTHTEIANQHVIDLNQKMNYKIVRIGPIWDEINRVCMIKDIRKQTPLSLLKNTSLNKFLISSEALYERLQSESLQLLDIRHHEDYLTGAIKNTRSCCWFDVHQLIKNKTLNKNSDIIVICYTGQSSMQVATLLNTMGYRAYSLLDGMTKWPYNLD